MLHFIDLGLILFFLIAICIAKKYKKLDILFYSTLFALLFENLNIILFHSTTGSYFYSNNFIMIFKVPLFVILSWGIIILTSFIIAEKITKDKFKMIFLIPLLTIILDLAFESSAIANNLWTWNAIIYNGFLTIPAENFIGWLLVSFSFSLSYMYLKQNYKWLSIFLSYILFILFTIIPFTISELFSLSNIGKMILFFILSLIFLFVFFYKLKYEKIKNIKKEYIVIILFRISFYIFPLLFMNSWIYDIYALIIYFISLIIEIIIHYIIIKRYLTN
jgi:hypothetical protein